MRFFVWRRLLPVTFLFVFGTILSAQTDADKVALLTPTYQYSKQKTSYITLTSGKELEGNVKDFDRKRGVIDYIKIKTADGKVHKLDAARIKSAYLHPSAMSSMASFFDDLDAQRWGKDLEQELFKEGYVYLETVMVKISKKKSAKLLLQLLNPHFSDGVRIYFDPFANKSAGLAVGPVKLVGGNAKSYIVKKEDSRIATYLFKGTYAKEFEGFFGDCGAVAVEGKKPKWGNLAKHVYLYSTECAR